MRLGSMLPPSERRGYRQGGTAGIDGVLHPAHRSDGLPNVQPRNRGVDCRRGCLVTGRADGWEALPVHRTRCGAMRVSTVKLSRGTEVKYQTAIVGPGRLDVV